MRRGRHRGWLALGLVLLACAAVVPGALGAGASSAVGENVSPGDGVSAVAGASSSAGENVTPGDAVGLHSGVSSSVGENVTPGDAIGLHPSVSSSIGENVTPGDKVTLTPSAQLTVGENVTPNDSVRLSPSQQLAIGENVTPADAVSSLPGGLLTLNENVTPGDGASASIVNTVPKLVLPTSLRAFEGAQLTATGSFVDPDPQTWTLSADWGDGTQIEKLPINQDKTFPLVHAYDDNKQGGYTIMLSLSDGIATAQGTIHVDVENVAPTATLANSGPVDEGSPAQVTFTQPVDPSQADTTAGFTYAYDCGAGSDTGAGYGAPTTAAAGTCSFDDQGTYTVTAKIMDKDGGATEYTTGVVVRNVAPTATLAAPATVPEGSPATLSFSGQLDPSKADTAAGFSYAYDCGSGYGQPTSDASSTCTFDDGPSSHVVRAKIMDKDGGSTEYTQVIDVTNVAPTASLGNDGPVNEGSPATISFSNQQDPSNADTTAGFVYRYACDGSTFGQPTTNPSKTCIFDDGPSTHTVAARILDKDGGSTDYTTDVVVNNVPPSATFNAPAAVDEGSPFTLSLTNPTDPSNADTAAGFTYAFDCGDGSGLGAFSSSSTATCPTNDNGTRNVVGEIKDKDGGVSTYNATVTVRNVAPTATLVAPSSANEGDTFTVALKDPVDPSSADTAAGFSYAFDCGSGYGSPSSAPSTSCPAVDDPGADVNAKIIDKDGGTTEYTAHVAIANLPPVVQITGPPRLSAYSVGIPVFFTGSFTDPGVQDTHTAQWQFDALNAPGSVTESHGSGTVSGSFTFTTPGIYSVTLRVVDNAGAAGTSSTIGGAPELVAVFDPSRGKVTGGGWVPAGGKGKTTFDVNAQYQGGTLTGNAGAQLAGGGTMKATALQWLVVVGNRAELAGTATVNGTGGYAFLEQVVGSGGDALRLKVWRTSDGSVVYDNVPGSSDDLGLATPQPLGGGNLTIH